MDLFHCNYMLLRNEQDSFVGAHMCIKAIFHCKQTLINKS